MNLKIVMVTRVDGNIIIKIGGSVSTERQSASSTTIDIFLPITRSIRCHRLVPNGLQFRVFTTIAWCDRLYWNWSFEDNAGLGHQEWLPIYTKAKLVRYEHQVPEELPYVWYGINGISLPPTHMHGSILNEFGLVARGDIASLWSQSIEAIVHQQHSLL